MARRDHEPICTRRVGRRLAFVVIDDRNRHSRGWGVALAEVNQRMYSIARQNLQRCLLRRPRKRMGVFANVDRSMDSLARSILDDGLSDGRNVVVVERTIQRVTTVTRGAKGYLLFGDRHIR